jgi:hypothetical protein
MTKGADVRCFGMTIGICAYFNSNYWLMRKSPSIRAT